jgi:hypothetical protein
VKGHTEVLKVLKSLARGRAARRVLSITIPLLVLLPLTAGQAVAQASPEQGTAAQAAAPQPSVAAGVSPTQAEKQARQTGEPVAVTALTTPTSQTTANPSGTLSTTQSLEPVRAWHGGKWQALNPALHANPDATVSPAVTTTALTLSGGGSGPLVVMSNGPRSVSLSWPSPLPAPVLSGATATYDNVLPGVNLVVTAGSQGGFSDDLVVTSAKAAANPALSSLRLTVATHGLQLSATKAGNITAAAGPTAPALYTTAAPLMWDSSPSPAGTTVPGPDGTQVNEATGQQADSSLTAPGAGAHVTQVPLTLSGGTLTLAPPAAALTGKDVTYPLYIDPTWSSVGSSASAWTQVDSGFPATSYWRESSDLQVGKCPADITAPSQSCNGMGVARSYFELPVPSALKSNSKVNSAYLYMTEVWSPSCTKESVSLGETSTISSSTTWNNQPTWSTLASQSAAFGYPGCGYYKNDITWNVTSRIATDAGKYTTQPFGLRATDESNEYAWKMFNSGSSNITLAVTYDDPPNAPASLATSPGGNCQASAASAPVIGNDDVTFSAEASDNTADNSLSTRFVILNAAGATVYDSSAAGTSVVTGNKTTARLILARSVMRGLSPGGATTEVTYHWHAVTTNPNDLTGPTSGTCYFSYNPLGPAAPVITAPDTGQLGQTIAATFTAPTGCGPTTAPCPVSYTYQLGARAPVTVTADSSGDWSGTITVNQIGPIDLTVYGTAVGGNLGESTTASLTGTAPATPYADGYFTGGTYPDLLTLGTGKDPSLWLSQGDGNGSVGPATDIGSLGTGLNPGTDGPGDWAEASVLHGDFTGDNVQDVMAYYPATGNGVVIAGNGNASPLEPGSGNLSTVDSDLMTGATGDDPSVLVAAGNASEIGTGADDLIGISGDATNGYELDLYTNGQCAECSAGGDYAYDTTLATQAPDGTDDWQNYSLATAQPGGNPGAVVLFALDTATGTLWQYTNSSQSASTVIGTCDPATTGTCSNWSQITSVPWTTSPSTLLSADINQAGQTELWATIGGTPAAYTLSGTTLSMEVPGGPLPGAAADDWPLNDGSPFAQTSTATTATDSVTGAAVTVTGGATWGSDPYFGSDLTLNGQVNFVRLPSGTIPATATTPSISVWFQTTAAASEALVSLQEATDVTPNGSATGNYDPVMYIGSDGILHAEWWQGAVAPVASRSPVDDGLWHHAVLTETGNTQALYVDGKLQATLTGGFAPSDTGTNLFFGAGYLGGHWPDEAHYSATGNTGYPSFFTGQLADITVSYYPTALYEVQASDKNGDCLDDRSDGAANGNIVQIYRCNQSAAQGWELVPSLDEVPGHYQLQHSTGGCLDDPADSAANGTKLELWTCLGNPDQEWTARPVNGSYTEYVNANGMCLDNTGNTTTIATQVQILACNPNAPDEQWYGPSPTS